MKNNRNQQVILKSRPADIPQADNFAIVASEIPDLHASDQLLKFAINRFSGSPGSHVVHTQSSNQLKNLKSRSNPS